MTTSLKVAVIGAGLSGLLAGRELVREGHRVVVYEKSDRLGGTWVYDPRVDSDPLGLSPDREIVHGSLYRSLRTNLPRPIMGFSDYSFEDRVYGDARNFPGHEEVLKFLEEFARDFGLGELIRFGNEVVRVERVDSASNDEWVVESRVSGVGLEVEVFEAVVVCNGRNTEPRLANFPGIEKWPGKQLHSHNYRVPEPFRDQVVVMIGNGPSAYDISREVATVAKQVHLSSRSPNIEVSKFKNYDNIWQHSKISYVDEDGTVAFEDGFSIQADTIFHCTGYKFHFPFLKTNGIVCVEDKRVEPLYKHVFPPQLAPRLSFIGVKAIIFCFFELQSKWVAKTLSGKVTLPSKEEMMADVEQHYHHMEGSGIPKHQTHSPNPLKIDYLDWLGDQVGSPVEDRVKETYVNFVNYFISNQEGFRDKFLQSSQQLPCDDQSI